MTIDLRLFGALRGQADNGLLPVAVTLPAKVADIRAKVAAQLSGDTVKLLDSCVFATDSAILADDDLVPAGAALSLLPPVSGG